VRTHEGLLALREIVSEATWNRRIEDPKILLGSIVEGGSGNAEVLGKNLFWRVIEPVGNEERAVLGEIAIVEHQYEFASVRAEALD
jgi:hypothetical protein